MVSTENFKIGEKRREEMRREEKRRGCDNI